MENYNLNNFSPSDLIFLYLDGEASEIERTLLFNSLAGDEALQLELQDAISMKYATAKEAEDIVPATALTNSLFGTLGISTIANVTSQTMEVSSLLKYIDLMKTPIMLVINSLLVGGLLTYSAMRLNTPAETDIANKKITSIKSSLEENYISKNLENSLKQVLPKTTNRINEIRQNINSSKKTNQQVFVGTSDSIRDINHYVEYQTKDKGIALKLTNGAIQNKVNGSRPIDNMPNIIKDNRAIDNMPNINNDSFTLGKLPNKYFSNNPLDPKQYFSEPLPIMTNKIVDIDSPKETTKEDEILNIQDKVSDYSLKLNGINNLVYIANSNNAVISNKRFDNLQITALYKINENSNIGLTFGNEIFPIYIKQNNEFVLTNNLVYFGAVYNWNIFEIEYAGKIRSNFNFIFAATQTSSINKTGMELTWFPDKKLGLFMGIEAFTNVSNYRGALEFSGKTNLYYGITYNF